MNRARTRRAALAASLVAVLAASSLAAAGAAPRRGDPPRAGAVGLRVLSSSQRALLRERAVPVRVSSPRASVVRVAVAGSPPRTVRFRGRGARVVRLPLGTGARRALERCRRQRVVVRARVLRGRVRPGTPATRAVTLDLPACRGAAVQSGAAVAGPGPSATATSPSSAGNGEPADGGGEPGDGGGSTTVAGAEDRKCDFLDPAVCLQPWPNDWFTKADVTQTGRRLNIDQLAMPRNVEGKPIDNVEYNWLDGFSPGNMIVTRVPGLDSQEAFRRTGAVPITDMARYADPDQPVVVIDEATGERHPIWSEVDANPQRPQDVNLIIRPAVNFREGHRYIVALRNLRDAGGRVIPAGEGFRAYRDRLSTGQPVVEGRRRRMEEIFAALGRAGIARQDLYLAWDFTVASRSGLTRRMLAMRDDAFRALGDRDLADLQVQGRAPAFTVDEVTNFTPEQDARIARRVEGKVTVPCYLNLPGCPPGATFLLDSATGLPMQAPANTTQARFTCHVPRSTMAGGPPARVSLYGHGLFGSRNEINQGQLKDFGNEHNLVFCATDWIGMACADLPTDPAQVPAALQRMLQSGYTPNCDLPVTATILKDLSNFPKLADRVQQGMLNFLYLGRAMVHPQGFATDPAFRRPDGSGLLDTTRLFYDGNSQGGIIGGALTAVAVDHERAVLGVPGMNYSTLLRRSVDFDRFATGKFVDELPDTPLGLYDNYPSELERPLLISLVQLLWDRAEANGYAQHMTDDPLPNTPAHKVLLHLAFGDHQVANVAAEVEARTIGARARAPYLEPGRSPYVTTTPWGIPEISSFPFDGSAIVMWDSGPIRQVDGRTRGTAIPPATNTPPREGDDPHEYPRREVAARVQKSEFLRVGGRVVDVCGALPCFSDGYAGGG